MNWMNIEQQYTSGVYGKRNLTIVRGKGAHVWDADGREYIDCAAGIGVASIGHSHPAVAAAIAEQAQTLITCAEMFYNDRRAELLEKLVSILPDGLNRVFLCNSGSEAIEAAIKFARLSTGRPGVIAMMRGFHGRTMGALSATHKKKYRQPFEPLVPGFTHVPFGNIEKLDADVTGQTAAVVMEVVQGEGGVRLGEADYFRAVRGLCDERGALLIIDEVQTGFGRTGQWFACQHYDLVPDLLTMGKAIAGGVPMGVAAIGPRIDGLTTGVHGSTFGGNPLACAASLATLQVYEEEGLVARSAELGAYFLERLQEINSPLIREARGLGLMLGIEMKDRVHPVVETLMDRGVLALTAGTTVLRLLPPLVIERDDVDVVVDTLRDVLVGIGG
jgi:acetylornithine/LysW-gamma-L-lysine aminotransferase